jgi:hypothetical protein
MVIAFSHSLTQNTPVLRRKTMGNHPKEIRELIAEKRRAKKR